MTNKPCFGLCAHAECSISETEIYFVMKLHFQIQNRFFRLWENVANVKPTWKNNVLFKMKHKVVVDRKVLCTLFSNMQLSQELLRLIWQTSKRETLEHTD